MMGDELGHLIRQAAQQANIDYRPHLYGHIASYDPLLHRVRCIIPSLTDEDGSPLLSPWMPMGTASSGDGYGLQVIYKGGASVTNPTAGEQVLISLFDKVRGVAAVPCLFYHSTNRPPATNLPLQSDGYQSDADPIAAGDVIISNPSTTDGGANTFVRIRSNGDIEMWGAAKLVANVIGEADVTTINGDINVTAAKGHISATASEGNIAVTSTQGSVTVTASSDITLDVPTVVMTHNLHVTGVVIAGFGTTDQVGLQTHRHGLTGSSASSTVVPSPGT